MKMLTTRLIPLLLLLTIQASASSFFVCKVTQGRTTLEEYSGIQTPCEKLGAGWCATDCNWFGYNCGICQYKEAGKPKWEDIKALEDWCSKDKKLVTLSPGRAAYRTPHIERYGFQGIRQKCTGCTGCDYVDTPYGY